MTTTDGDGEAVPPLTQGVVRDALAAMTAAVEALTASVAAQGDAFAELKKAHDDEAKTRRRHVRALGVVLAAVVVLGFFQWRAAVDRAEAEDRAERAQCVSSNDFRQDYEVALVALRDGFQRNADTLLAASGIDVNNLPPAGTEQGDQVRVFLAGQAALRAQLDGLVGDVSYRDCNNDGSVNERDGVDP